jgi:hypothetical protein
MKKRSKSATKKASRPVRKNAFSSKGGRLSIFSPSLSVSEKTFEDGRVVMKLGGCDLPMHITVQLPPRAPVLELEIEQFMAELGTALPQVSKAREDQKLSIRLPVSFLKWADQRNWLPAMAPVSQKIAVGCKDDGILLNFRHSHQARVGERHWHTGVAL